MGTGAYKGTNFTYCTGMAFLYKNVKFGYRPDLLGRRGPWQGWWQPPVDLLAAAEDAFLCNNKNDYNHDIKKCQ
jgi:hypothetical protein